MQGFRIVMPAKKDVKAYKNIKVMVLAKELREVYISGGVSHKPGVESPALLS
jgi:hypothetical protein